MRLEPQQMTRTQAGYAVLVLADALNDKAMGSRIALEHGSLGVEQILAAIKALVQEHNLPAPHILER